ncbi:hypothetical protein D3H45_10690, partial [Streptococcus pyogenes]
EVRRLFYLYPYLTSMTLLLEDSSAYLYADRVIKTGRLLYSKPVQTHSPATTSRVMVSYQAWLANAPQSTLA